MKSVFFSLFKRFLSISIESNSFIHYSKEYLNTEEKHSTAEYICFHRHKHIKANNANISVKINVSIIRLRLYDARKGNICCEILLNNFYLCLILFRCEWLLHSTHYFSNFCCVSAFCFFGILVCWWSKFIDEIIRKYFFCFDCGWSTICSLGFSWNIKKKNYSPFAP